MSEGHCEVTVPVFSNVDGAMLITGHQALLVVSVSDVTNHGKRFWMFIKTDTYVSRENSFGFWMSQT